MNNDGVYVSFRYLAKRKRKSVPKGFSGSSLVDVLQTAREWLIEHGGRFLNGKVTTCKRWCDIVNGKEIWMVTMPIFAPAAELEEDLLETVNRGA